MTLKFFSLGDESEDYCKDMPFEEVCKGLEAQKFTVTPNEDGTHQIDMGFGIVQTLTEAEIRKMFNKFVDIDLFLNDDKPTH